VFVFIIAIISVAVLNVVRLFPSPQGLFVTPIVIIITCSSISAQLDDTVAILATI